MMRERKIRRGQIFTLDVLIAFVILLIGIAILYYDYPYKSKSYYVTERLSEDVIGVLAETKISDLCSNPGESIADGCACANYDKLETVVCNSYIRKKDADLLSFFTEVISNGYSDGDSISAVIHEMFVNHNVIDEKRFGFAVIYTTGSYSEPLELYNTETYSGSS